MAGRFLIRRLAWVLGAAAAVTISLAVFGAEHTPNYTFNLFGFSATNGFSLKSKVATGILALALLQLLLALWIYGKTPGGVTAPHHVRNVHRICGIVLFLATLPVAIHCMYAYGVQTTSARVTVHSLAGCFFYGAFVAKVLVVRSRRCRVGSSPLQVACSSALSRCCGTQAPSGSSTGTAFRAEPGDLGAET